MRYKTIDIELNLIPGKFVFYKGPKYYDEFRLAFKEVDELDASLSNIRWKCIRYHWKQTVYIWAYDYKNVGLVAHEIVHWINHIFELNNIEDEELFCYTLQYLLNKLY